MTWHADVALLTRYRTGALPAAHASSVETHVVGCATCQERFATLATPEEDRRLDALWADIVATVDAPKASVVEQVLRRVGVRDDIARLLAATPSLRLSWLTGVTVTLVIAVLTARAASDPDAGLFVFLVLAPLLPVVGVAAAFGPGMDPTHEIGRAAPLHGARLLLVRAVAVIGTTTALAGLASAALPQTDWRVAAWLLPALGLTSLTIVLSTRWSTRPAAGSVAAGWVALAIMAVSRRPLALAAHGDLIERSVAFRPAGQLAFLLVAIIGALVVRHRRTTLDLDLGRIA